eukprot:TRINITY_DN4839_c0_g1_i4.p1 TRINITY_DN4839_c0_g1~~TRINITY_DN4839_c0_g1_i4.p1  ORF type:complete len:505 (+),score=85.54 TRINITY_DN4839_c0_g1_i4:1019-2533(+)
MKQCASTLFEFDGGETCIRAYLTSRDIFLNTRYLMEDANVLSEQYNLKRVYDDLVSVCQEECIIIREVFPNPERVVRALIEKIFQQRVQAILERALEKRDTIEPSLFLEKMEVIHDLTISLGNRMEQFEVRDVSINMLVNDILTLFRESYIEVEKKYVESLFQSKLKAIMISTGQPEQKKKQGFGNILGKAKDEHSYLDTISLELCESYLTAAQKSLQRCRKLSSGEQIAENMAHLVDIMLKALFTNYLISATRRAVDHIPIADRRGPPIIQFFEAVMLVNAATQKYLLLVAEEVVPVLKDAFQFYTSTKVEQETALMALEDLLRDGLQKASATIVTHISHIMEDDQKKNDFRPREDESFEDTTLACVKVVTFLKSQYDPISSGLTGENKQSFVRHLALQLEVIFIAHYKKFAISDTGALRLLKDLKEFQTCMSAYCDPFVDELFDDLRDLASLLIVIPENLPNLIQESRFAKRVGKQDVYRFIQNRQDFKSANIARLFPDMRT